MPTCEDCGASGAQLRQGDLTLCKHCADKRFSPHSEASNCQGDSGGRIVINDLLCFIVNKMDRIPGDVISKMCLDTYTEIEIEAAKKLVFDTCQPSERPKERRGANKSTANMSDILRVLHSTDLSTLPTFVSATLHIPAVDLEHIDITVCLQELQIMRQEMKLIRACSIDAVRVQAELSSLRRDIVDLKNDRMSAPTTQAPSRATFAAVVSDNPTQTTVHASATRKTSAPDHEHGQCQVGGPALVPKPKAPAPRHHATPRRRRSGDPTAPDADGFSLVQRRKPRSKAVVGTAKSSILLAAKARPAEIFVTRLGPETQPKDIERYLRDNLSQEWTLSCENLPTKYDTYSSFRVAINSDAVPEILSPSFWPCGVLVRRFHGRRPSATPQP
ncbi:Hypp8827 [Branchiostoma lanceolatum]|uniref:Hypp8827 protein n=1 Tax=Branchiostoma lanceolatum TaxID=7740 RepID=A0A8K0EJ60_BRALA|nr:Hypp8827 [Branchiostoma lanceolatum]